MGDSRSLCEAPWYAYTPRQLTGAPYRYHGYVSREKKRAERLCHKGYHRSPETAFACAQRAATKLNKETSCVT